MEREEKYLVDTNVWLERLLDQEKSEVAALFFEQISTDRIFISDFSLHSVGVILTRLEQHDVFQSFIEDLFVNGEIKQLLLDPVDLLKLKKSIKKFRFDFDDSYQYLVAQKYELTIVTFDKDFSAKDIPKKSPDEIIVL